MARPLTRSGESRCVRLCTKKIYCHLDPQTKDEGDNTRHRGVLATFSAPFGLCPFMTDGASVMAHRAFRCLAALRGAAYGGSYVARLLSQ